jgi:hypothetical protein
MIYPSLKSVYGINVNQIFYNITNKSVLVPPFVMLKIKKSIILNQTTKEDLEYAYQNIKKTFNLEEKHNCKIVKSQNEEYMCIILFFDSLNHIQIIEDIKKSKVYEYGLPTQTIKNDGKFIFKYNDDYIEEIDPHLVFQIINKFNGFLLFYDYNTIKEREKQYFERKSKGWFY